MQGLSHACHYISEIQSRHNHRGNGFDVISKNEAEKKGDVIVILLDSDGEDNGYGFLGSVDNRQRAAGSPFPALFWAPSLIGPRKKERQQPKKCFLKVLTSSWNPSQTKNEICLFSLSQQAKQ
jgi:hypothetical protein